MSSYDITIAGVTGAAPSDGFIDPKTIYQYMNANPTDVPASYAVSLAKARANRRYKNLVSAIQFYSGLEIASATAGGSPTTTVAPTNLVIRVNIADVNSVKVADENNVGQFLTGIAAIKRIVARSLIRSQRLALEVYDPTPAKSTSFPVTGPRINAEDVGALYANLTTAEAGITVAAV